MTFSPFDLAKRRLRKYLRKGFGDRLFESIIAQRLLGYRLDDAGRITERFAGMDVRYRYDSLPGKCVFLGGEYEEDDAAFCLGCLGGIPNPVVFDAGANVGFHTIRWLKALRCLRALAVEANPETAAMLRHNVEVNGFLQRCAVHELALGDRDDEVEFILSRDDAFSSLISNRRSPEKTRVKVAMRTLDHVVGEANLDRLDLLKVDVEGAELLVLAGAEETLRRLRPQVFMEICSKNNPDVNPEDTVRRMVGYGYEARVVIEGKSVPWTTHDDRHANYHFRPVWS